VVSNIVDATKAKVCPIFVLSSTISTSIMLADNRITKVDVDNSCIREECQWWGFIDDTKLDIGCMYAAKKS